MVKEERKEDNETEFGKIVDSGVTKHIYERKQGSSIWKMFLAWKRDLFDEEGTLRRKTFWWQWYAFEKFLLILHS